MKKLLEIIVKTGNFLFPKSRAANVVYMIIGIILANYADFEAIFQAVMSLFK
jgi:hypothetical protein